MKPIDDLKYYTELSRANNISECKTIILNIVQELGFTDFSYIQLVKADTPQPELCTMPANLLRTYFDNNFFVHDMALQKAAGNTEPFFQSTINEYLFEAPFVSEMTRGMEAIFKLYKSYAYYDHYRVPGKLIDDSTPALFSITKRGTSPVELKHQVKDCELAIILLSQSISDVLVTHFQKYCFPCRGVTTINPKPLRVLETLANSDFTIEQVAEKLSISVVTANQHLKTVRDSLGTRTNYAAIKRAILEKLIQLDKSPTQNIQSNKYITTD